MNIADTKRMRILTLIAVILLLPFGCSPDPYGAKVILHNVGTVPLHSVVVRVTGNAYSFGELAASDTCTVKTYATGESNIVIEYLDTGGQKKELTVDCYFEPGYRKTISVKVTADSATKTEN